MPLRVHCMHRIGKTSRFKILPLVAGAALFIATGITSLVGADAPSALPVAPSVSPAKRAQVQAATAKLPLRFEQNVGQVKGPNAQDVRFISRGSAFSLFLTPKEAVLAMQRSAKTAKGAKSSAVVSMRLSGANQSPAISGQEEFPGKSNYLIGRDPSQWHTGVTNFGRVAEQGVYPGIDLVYHGHQGQLEYDFDLAPHADPKNIRITFDGATRLQLDPSGNLLVAVAGGDLLFKQPVAYQSVQVGSRNLVPVRYKIHGKNQVTFELASYDRLEPLVIDPILSYSTYIGGSNIDSANGIAIAPDGTAFIAGGTFSTNFPTAHALQPNDGGSLDFPQDAIVAKLSADGSTLLWHFHLPWRKGAGRCQWNRS